MRGFGLCVLAYDRVWLSWGDRVQADRTWKSNDQLTKREREKTKTKTALTWCTAYCLYIDKCRRFFFGQFFSPLLLKLFLALSAQASPAVPCCTQWNVHLEQLGLASQPVWNVHWEQLGQASQPVWNVHWNSWARNPSMCEMLLMFSGNSWARHPSLCEMFIGTIGPGIPACAKCSL